MGRILDSMVRLRILSDPLMAIPTNPRRRFLRWVIIPVILVALGLLLIIIARIR